MNRRGFFSRLAGLFAGAAAAKVVPAALAEKPEWRKIGGKQETPLGLHVSVSGPMTAGAIECFASTAYPWNEKLEAEAERRRRELRFYLGGDKMVVRLPASPEQIAAAPMRAYITTSDA